MISLEETANELLQTVEQARTELLGIDEADFRFRPTPDRWSIAQVVGHLVDSATNNHQRFIRGQLVEELIFPGYQQNEWADLNDYHEADQRELVELFYLYNVQLSRVIRMMEPSHLPTRCSIAPYDPCTLEYLVEDYVVHLKHHLEKIRERITD